ncbi:MAG: RidA family protein [Tissierellaceae bacterium]|jgi:2-iminobutanoate/2-iminopropanoate deaminase|nr:RidA family protein [Tissierellia bacterium]
MSLELIATTKAPGAVGPYSQGVKAGNIIFTSGQLHIDPENGQMLKGDIQEQTRLCLENVKAILEEGGAKLEDVVKVTIFLTDMAKFSAVNEIYGQYFSNHKPARSCVAVKELPLGGEVEIEAVAVI